MRFPVVKLFMLFAVLSLKAETIRLSSVELEAGEKIATDIVHFPLLQRLPGKVPVLKARIFYDKPKPEGWNYAVSLFLNVRKMSVMTYGGKKRLLRSNMPETASESGEKEIVSWYRSGWLVMMGPGTGVMDARLPQLNDEGWWYFFDISDLANYTDTECASGENLLQIGCYSQAGKRLLKCLDMEIVYLDEEVADQMRK